ncbi:hypothetical protein GWK47_025335 [Chionoecetes opilio]|uniref:Beta/gamma crystallin 'Greek key' domain-containing protein n=1 Tax=Chionoecetes opilio TaxID=41210 RepID=A0A8J8WF90_CHIOP|nr:hypothetical protein GWK47_025335 [Chionoecetes opilio]
MKSLLVLSLLVLGTQAQDSTTLFSELHQQGNDVSLTESVELLQPLDFNDKAKSIIVNGVWIYYQHASFNELPGMAFLAYGTNASMDLPSSAFDSVSSVRNVKLALDEDENMITLFKGMSYAAQEVTTNTSLNAIIDVYEEVSSLITSGMKPWTVYT